GTYADAAFAGHDTHDLLLSNNEVKSSGNTGKTWRLLVLTGSGQEEVIEANTVVGSRPQDRGPPPSPNDREVVLTASYRVRFEGKPLAVSSDGLVVLIPDPQGDSIECGDALAIVAGSSAGQWRRVVQVLDARTILLDAPFPPGADIVSIARGFVDQTF